MEASMQDCFHNKALSKSALPNPNSLKVQCEARRRNIEEPLVDIQAA